MRTLLAVALALVLAGSAGAATIQGTKRAERIAGTARVDLILARGGADRVTAGAGDDRVAVQYDGARDTVACGAGRDIVNADLTDRTAADCEVVSRRLSRDIYSNADSRHETQVEPDSFTFGRTTVAVFQTGRRFEGAAANIAFATSTDDSATWRAGELPGITKLAPRAGTSDRASDPVVSYDAAHGVWLASSLAVSQPTRLTINRSPDGLGWSDPIDAASATASGGIAYDKQWLACDNGTGSPFRGRCYLAYSDFVRGGLSVQTSSDGGLTWSQPVSMAPLSVVGAFPAIQPDGTLAIVYRTGARESEELAAVRSRDGGATLEAPVRVSPIDAFAVSGLRLPVLPSVDVDRTGRIWVAWHDCRLRRACLGNDVVASTSTDGIAWTAPRRVTNGPTAAIPAIAVDPLSAKLAILYYAVRPTGIDAELVESTNGGATWSKPRRLSAETMQRAWIPATTQGRMLADYISVSYGAGGPLAVWALASEPAGGELRQAIFATRSEPPTDRWDARSSSARGSSQSPTGSAPRPSRGRRA
ncbi:MAG: glycoside hydrolase [Gaiellaceae bacterium MAG52_C11]|nr:glycoside hydrolase [Candidatus Gaiellasilicea maunaloa]